MEVIEFLLRRWHRLRQPRPPDSPPLRPVSFREPDRLGAAVLATRPALDRLLAENIVPFWLDRCLAGEEGYRLHHDEAGRWKGPAERYLVPQARTCWFFARLARSGLVPDAGPAARRGYDFLRTRLWDPDHEGFYWSLAPEGGEPGDDGKRLIAQLYGLYAVAEYARASTDAGAAAFAGRIFAVLERHARDPVHGGYWSRWSRAWVRGPDRRKSVNDHLHALEAFTTYARLAPDPTVRDRLVELLLILTTTVVRKWAGACTDLHREDWTPLLDGEHARVSYGHDVEAAWLALEACPAAGVPASLVLDWARTLVDYTLRWGTDRRRGGVYFAGPLGGPADSREKVWWVQAEVLVGALTVYRATGDPRSARLYLATLDWIVTRQADWAHGDWHATIAPSGAVSGDKAGLWKSPYHNGRAVLRCLELLRPGTPAGDREG